MYLVCMFIGIVVLGTCILVCRNYDNLGMLTTFVKVVLRKCTEMTWMTSQIDDLCLPASEKTLSPVSTPIKDQKSLGKCNHTPEGHQGIDYINSVTSLKSEAMQ